MRTESVAWLTARKDLLYGLFFFGGIYYYLKYREADRKRSAYLAGVWICFLLALFSKVLAVAFLVVLVLIDVLKDQRLDGRRLIAKTPFFLISIAFGLISIYLANSYESIEVQTTDFSLFDRLALASSAFVMYLAKLVFPYQMLPLYPYPREIAILMWPTLAYLFCWRWVFRLY